MEPKITVDFTDDQIDILVKALDKELDAKQRLMKYHPQYNNSYYQKMASDTIEVIALIEAAVKK
jgi:hypothetical protein